MGWTWFCQMYFLDFWACQRILATEFNKLWFTHTYTMHTHLKYIWIIDNLYLKESIQLYPREIVPVDLNNHIPSKDKTSQSIRGNVRAGGRQAASCILQLANDKMADSILFSFPEVPIKSPTLLGCLCHHFLNGDDAFLLSSPMLPHKCVVRINEIMSTVF